MLCFCYAIAQFVMWIDTRDQPTPLTADDRIKWLAAYENRVSKEDDENRRGTAGQESAMSISSENDLNAMKGIALHIMERERAMLRRRKRIALEDPLEGAGLADHSMAGVEGEREEEKEEIRSTVLRGQEGEGRSGGDDRTRQSPSNLAEDGDEAAAEYENGRVRSTATLDGEESLDGGYGGYGAEEEEEEEEQEKE
jgi:hypothetical protein